MVPFLKLCLRGSALKLAKFYCVHGSDTALRMSYRLLLSRGEFWELWLIRPRVGDCLIKVQHIDIQKEI
ncbi:hypothetical protein BGC22_00610 [Corynebacterium amycolatum]|nr:hypothetical protein BGC22_00610 [Corynebacterium amycolatum]